MWCVNPHTADVDAEVARACRASLDAGIRAAIVYPIVEDTGPDVFERVEALAADYASASIDVQLGPANPQRVPEWMLVATSEHARRTNRAVHMHLLETPDQRHWADTTHSEGFLRWLDQLGLLGPGTTLAHGTYLRADEMAFLDERGCCLALNASSNLRLASGVPPVAAAMATVTRRRWGWTG